MRLKLLYFARLREQFATSGETLDLDVGNVAELLDALRGRGVPWATELETGRAFRVAVNQDVARQDTPLHAGDEVALFPPVTGG